MSSVREIPFSKLHGLGNDWIVVERAAFGDLSESAWPRLGISVCNRHTGVGADGLIVVAGLPAKAGQARIRFFNADGSEAEMSGNGIRCAGAYLLKAAVRATPRRRGRSPAQTLQIATAAGVKTLEVVAAAADSWTFRVAMGAPILDPARIHFSGSGGPGPVLRFPLKIDGRTVPVTVTSMGNPHCSLFLDDLGVQDFEEIDWAALGKRIEHHTIFRNRTNVEFVRKVSGRTIEVRFWERGVGPTQSSGTGSCAAAVAAILNGVTLRRVRVKTLAGTLDVAWPRGGEVRLTGPAVFIAKGIYHFRY